MKWILCPMTIFFKNKNGIKYFQIKKKKTLEFVTSKTALQEILCKLIMLMGNGTTKKFGSIWVVSTESGKYMRKCNKTFSPNFFEIKLIVWSKNMSEVWG